MNRLFVAILPALLIASYALPAAAEDWPRFRGPTGQGISTETGVPTQWSATENVAWKTPIPGAGWSSPIVLGDRLFLTTATDEGRSFRVLCLDRKTGAITWNKEIVQQEPGNKSGQNSWATATPTTDGERVYVLAFDGTTAALAFDGAIVWTNRDFKYYSQHGLGVSPLVWQDLVIVPFDWSSRGPEKRVGWQIPWDQSVIYAYDKATGKVRWQGKRGLSRIGHVTPQVVSVDGRDQLISPAGDVVQGFDPKTGECLWTVKNTGEAVVPAIVIGDGLVFATSGFNNAGSAALRAVRLGGGKGDCTATHIAWEQTKAVPMIPSMLYVKPYLYTVAETGMARCLKADTGEMVWENRLKGSYSASPIWAEGRIYFTNERAETTIIQAGPEFKILAQNAIGEKCQASPAVSQKQIFIRTEGNLYAIGK